MILRPSGGAKRESETGCSASREKTGKEREHIMGARAQGEFSDRKRTCNDILPCMGAFTVNRKRDTQKGP